MIKGINKQIVEINYTKNDYIEKAILIINPQKSDFPIGTIKKQADEYMKTLLIDTPKKNEKNYKKLFLLLSVTAIISTVAIIVFMNVMY